MEDLQMSKPEVIIYSQPGWHFCSLEKAWLSKQGIDFKDRNITEDPDAMAELQGLGYFSTPVTIINDHAVVGFNREELTKLLDLD